MRLICTILFLVFILLYLFYIILNEMRKSILYLFLFLFSTLCFFSQVKINEYSVSNSTVGIVGPTFSDNQGNKPDWIELYNQSASAINIGGFGLTDNSSTTAKYIFPLGTLVPANGFLRVWCSCWAETNPVASPRACFTAAFCGVLRFAGVGAVIS